ncbi:phytanoyl-CoA dioxygenase family protein [Horticoccus luteus]|uniref:Phytanoyl-CoA dioxygenase family protein n=1 Tax=Horticoccus luteus TaxID=2862869 RepID=A0A8F9XI30_9BACT|nr:phytanoyl-CoA dioxygenase family protein [Horticoccus luteus]QYM79990.1 phytanoyl-CoA dioxygenase family protein [Horticoccus luteus]
MVATTFSSPPARLTSEQVAEFNREGWLMPREPVFAQPKFDRLKGFFDHLLDELDTGTRPEAMDVPHFQHPELFEWLFSDEVMGLVQPILGPDIALFASHFICKPRGNGKRVPWHEDSAYWRGMLDRMEVVTVWLAIDPSTKENGCMYVVPRTHNTGKSGFSDYDDISKEAAVFPTEITRTQRNDAAAVAVELAPNHCSLHDGRLIHGSPPNTSSLRRCGYTMRYISTRSRLNVEDFPWHQIYLARGQDRAGNAYADPTKAYHEKARFRAAHGKNGH